MEDSPEKLRIALLTGSLSLGGAEKQLLYTAKVLHDAGVNVCVFSFDSAGFYKQKLQDAGIPVIVINHQYGRISRLLLLIQKLYDFKPHIIQTTQLFTGIYAALAGTIVNAISIVNMRCDLATAITDLGHWGMWLSTRLSTSVITKK